MWGFWVIPCWECRVRYQGQGGISFWRSELLDFASILIKIGQTSPAPQEQTSPLNLMAIFLKRVNLLLDRSLNGMIRIAVEIIFTGRDLRIHSTFVKVDVIYMDIRWRRVGPWRWPCLHFPWCKLFKDLFILGVNTCNLLLCIDESIFAWCRYFSNLSIPYHFLIFLKITFLLSKRWF